MPQAPGLRHQVKILGENLKALLRLIDNSAKLDCSLNTAPIPDFFPEAAMQRETFLRTRTKKRIRILPRVPTLQTYSFWAIGVIQRRWLARYCSIPAFFCTDAQRRPLWSRTQRRAPPLGRPPASRQSAWGAPGAGGARAARGLHLLCLASAPKDEGRHASKDSFVGMNSARGRF